VPSLLLAKNDPVCRLFFSLARKVGDG